MLMRAATIALAMLVAMAGSADANDRSARLRAKAYQLAYNLDYGEAAREMDAAAAADPTDVAAERGRAVIPWLLIPFTRGAATVDDYLGGVSRQNVTMRQPPADLAARFNRHAAHALTLAEAAVMRRPHDPETLYQLGATVALQASYIATVDGRIIGAYRAARRAYDTHERILELAPGRHDAGLVVGTYRYVVSLLSLPLRMMAYAAGFGGGKEQGIALIERTAAGAAEAAADAKFALVLLYNREARYADALRVIGELQRTYPRNRLLWLEAGATALRAGRAREAEQHLAEGRHMLAADTRPRMFGEEALWLQKHGAAFVALGRRGEARVVLERVLTLESRTWVTGRAHAELGKLADMQNDRATARRHFEQAVRLAEQDNDAIGAAAARRWVGTAYHR